MLTTNDNPFSPFTQFDDWDRFDRDHGYHTIAYIARIMIDSPTLPEDVRNQAFESAIDEIMEINVTGMYKKVYEDQDEVT